jgi:hypothetical protein
MPIGVVAGTEVENVAAKKKPLRATPRRGSPMLEHETGLEPAEALAAVSSTPAPPHVGKTTEAEEAPKEPVKIINVVGAGLAIKRMGAEEAGGSIRWRREVAKDAAGAA